jgi:hypothetical protein
MIRLDSVVAKIGRAEYHAKTLEDEIEVWAQSQPYTIAKETNAEATRFSVVVHVNNPPDLNRWSLITGDAFHNLRSALDHLVYSISVHQLNAETPPNEAAAPS